MEEFLVDDDHVDSDREEKDAAAEADVEMDDDDEEEEQETEGIDKEELLERKKQKRSEGR